MKKILSFFVVLVATSTLWASNVITYKATSKLNETTGTFSDGLHTDAFNTFITSHTFSNGTGTITFSGNVTSIGEGAFRGCSNLTSITIPNSVTSIGEGAFVRCSNLTSITIPNSVTSIGEGAFYECSNLTSITIPNSVTSIGDVAFYGCSNLTSVTIPNSVTSIGVGAFYECYHLTSITIPNSVTSIGSNAFYYCQSLTSVHISDIATWCGIAFGSIESNPLYLAKHLYINGNEVTDLNIPNSVTSVGDYAFSGCSSLTSITIPNSVTSIGSFAFFDCSSLTSITIPNSVTSIGKGAFSGCSSLTSITIPNSVTSVGDYAFSGCSSLTSITIPNSVTSIGSDAFSDCSNLTSVTIGNSVTSIGSNAFYYCQSLTSVHISDIAAWCGIAFGSIESNPLYLAKHLYINGNEVTDLNIPNSVTSIGDYAFSGCSSLTSITIPNSVTSIGEGAFRGCSSLTSITIPNSVTSIGSDAFSGCSGLTSIKVGPDNANYDSREHCNAIIETASNRLIVGCQNSTIPNSVTSIGDYAFSGCSSLTSITIPNSVTSIGSFAFFDCSNLTSITIPNSVTSIGSYAFYGCSNLTSFTIGNSVTSIGVYAFYECSALKTVYNHSKLHIVKGATTYGGVGYYAYNIYNYRCGEDLSWDFEGGKLIITGTGDMFDFAANSIPWLFLHDSIRSVSIEHGVTSIGSYAFYGCSNLTSITIPNSVTSIGEYAFFGCSALKTVYNHSKLHIVKGATTYGYVGYYAYNIYNYHCGEDLSWDFEGGKLIITGTGDMFDFAANSIPWLFLHDSIRSVSIEHGVTSIGCYAFYGCNNRAFTKLVLPQSVKTIGEYAFADCNRLTSIVFSSDMEEVGDYAFSGCTRINDMTCYATVTPDAYEHTFSGVNTMAYLYVQAGAARTYRLDPIWGVFDIQEIGAASTVVSDNSVSVVPSDNEAIFTWPTNTTAETYSLEITKDGEVFCTLIFNANGQLTGIAFAPGRNGTHAPAATLTENGYQFTVTGLDYATHYAFALDAKNSASQVVASYTGHFHTNGTTALEDVMGNADAGVQKIFHDGQMYILRGEEVYDATGRRVK